MNVRAPSVEETTAASKKQPSPRVSVCIPTYNYACYLNSAIESVLAQTFWDLELTVCDNASTDDTAELVRRYEDPRLKYRRYKIHVPVVYNLNRCLELGDGEYILILCADDRLAPDALELLVDALDRNPTAALAVAYQRQVINEAGESIGEIHRHHNGPGFLRGSEVLALQCHGGVACPSQVLARTEVLVRYSGFDPLATLTCDNDLYARICEEWDVIYVEQARYDQRVHEQMQTAKGFRNQELLRSDLFVVSRLFKTSSVLRANRSLRRRFIRNKMYGWFEHEAARVRRGHVAGMLCFLWYAWKFEPSLWWLPYYLVRLCLRGSRWCWKRVNPRLGRINP